METTDIKTSSFTGICALDYATEAIGGMKTEIFIFLCAFFIHALVFGKVRVRGKQKVAAKGKQVHDSTPSASAWLEKGASIQSVYAKALFSAAEKLLPLSPDEIEPALNRKLEEVPLAETCGALAGLLEGAGRSLNSPLLAAARKAVAERGVTLTPELGELMLRGCFGLRQHDDFTEILAQLEEAHGQLSNLDLLVIKAALRKGGSAGLQAALPRLRGFRAAWRADGGASAAPATILHQIVRLALQEDALGMLLKRLEASDFFEDSLPEVMKECAQHSQALSEVVAFARKRGTALSDACFCVLIKNATSGNALDLWREAVSNRPPSKELCLAAVDRAQAGAENLELAQEVLKKLPTTPPAEVAIKLLRYFAKGGLGASKDADSDILRMRSTTFKNVDLSADPVAQRIFAEATFRQFGAASPQFAKQIKVLPENVCVTLVQTLGKASHLEEALAVFHASSTHTACMHNAAMDACIDCRNLGKAHEVMTEAIRVGVSDIVTYNTMLKAYVQAGKHKEARSTVETMKKAGHKPNCITYNELLDVVVKVGIESAWSVLDEMKASEVKPNRITASILLKAIQSRSKGTDVERVLAVIDRLDEDVDEVLLCSMVEACIRAGRVDLLMPHLRKHRNACQLSFKSTHTYGSIIRAYGFVGDLTGCWDTWRELRSRQCSPSAVTLGCMVEALVTNGEAEASYELINEMVRDPQWSSQVNAVNYCSVLKGFSHQKCFDRMWAVYQEMLQHKLKFSIITYNTLVDACARNSQMQHIPALLKDMTQQGIQPSIVTYSAILKGYCQDNRIDEAFDLVNTMKESTEFHPDEIMYNTLLDGCARLALYDRGMGVYEDMLKSGITPSNFTLSVLVKLASRSKQLDVCFRLCEDISTKFKFRLNVHVYSNLVHASIANKDLKRALSVLPEMLKQKVRPDVRTYSLLLKAYLQAGDCESVASLLRAATGLPGVHPALTAFDPKFLQPQGDFPPALLSEVLQGLGNSKLNIQLLKELRQKPGLKIDPKLHFRIASQSFAQ